MAEGRVKPVHAASAAQVARAHQADREADLTAGGAGEELTQADEIGVGVLVDPLAAHHELIAEVTDVRDGATETAQPELEEDAEDLQSGAPADGRDEVRLRGGVHGVTRSRTKP